MTSFVLASALAFTSALPSVTLAAAPRATTAAPALEPKQKLTCAPAPGPTGLDHPFSLACTLAPGVNAANVVLFFRQGGAPDFTAAPTLRAKPGGPFVASLCAHDLVAGPLQYYFEARDATGRVVTSDGDEESPSVLVVAPATVVARPALVAASATMPAGASDASAPVAHLRPDIGDDNDPLAAVRRKQDENRQAERRSHRRQPGPMVGGSFGVGYGYYGERTLEFNRDLASDPSGGVAGLPLVMPEIGWQLGDRLTISGQLRWQPLNPGGSGDPRLGSPAKNSWALLARALYQLGEGSLRPFFGLNLGGGDGFRVVVPANPTAQLLRDDTIRGGPFLAGPSAGALYHFSRYVALAAELRVLAGLPNFALASELSAGAQFGF